MKELNEIYNRINQELTRVEDVMYKDSTTVGRAYALGHIRDGLKSALHEIIDYQEELKLNKK